MTQMATVPQTIRGEWRSVPADSPWIAVTTKSGKLAKWTLRHTRWGRWERTSEVTSMAASR